MAKKPGETQSHGPAPGLAPKRKRTSRKKKLATAPLTLALYDSRSTTSFAMAYALYQANGWRTTGIYFLTDIASLDLPNAVRAASTILLLACIPEDIEQLVLSASVTAYHNDRRALDELNLYCMALDAYPLDVWVNHTGTAPPDLLMYDRDPEVRAGLDVYERTFEAWRYVPISDLANIGYYVLRDREMRGGR